MDQARRERREVEQERLRALTKVSSIFQFQGHGDPPEQFTCIFRGRGVARALNAPAPVEYIDLHEIELRLPYTYPDQPPDIRWRTAIFHPNISFSGFIRLEDLGLAWEQEPGLDVLCERLWDVARGAYLDLEGATNHAARRWFDTQQEIELPVDPRALRDRDAPGGVNVIRYRREREKKIERPPGLQGDVLFIAEDTPTPELPLARPRPPRPGGGEDDVLYIDDK